ncbi:hypothetical protein IE81DRAFT_347894 [Ceraceosorus guamensis]|uniref:Chalcone isomerase domain-containing protein n=1 Tax=Ceraceosorus guamensis TaxID=1522189 RepID=A0A316VYM5_9BASI|nr:hypothetical protein IE81DRAFT_347894 [Ceraceosorus guamensis]PWN42008.1 hypothetical protein IE81DRAFT_347894 [Ceraceosorus guamensis]
MLLPPASLTASVASSSKLTLTRAACSPLTSQFSKIQRPVGLLDRRYTASARRPNWPARHRATAPSHSPTQARFSSTRPRANSSKILRALPRLSSGLTLVGGTLALLLALCASSQNNKVHSDSSSLSAIPLSTPSSSLPQSTKRTDIATGESLPRLLLSPATNEKLHLVGLGVRTVSFLRVRVYVAGLYVDGKGLERAKRLLGSQGKEESTEAVLRQLLLGGTECLIRIVPVRNTDMSHLRDGFLRSLQSRAKLARRSGSLNATDEHLLDSALDSLRSLFPKASVAKGQSLDLRFAGASRMDVLFKGKRLGAVGERPAPTGVRGRDTDDTAFDRWAGIGELLLAYVAEKGEISAPIKQDIEINLQHLAQKGSLPIE